MTKTRLKPELEYELKHRITGAAILIGLAVIVIPLLLKEPVIQASIDSKPEVAEEQAAFKSKIEPLNLNTINLKKGEVDPGDDLKPALLNANEVVALDPDSEDDQSDTSKNKKEKKKEKQQIVLTEQEDSADTEAVAETVESQPESTAVEQSNAEPDVLEETDSGWAVRVGTFAKKENVDSISQMLSKSGFNARHTKVQTTLGEATRVWLGPYANKDTADKVSLRLKNLTGEKGYVTKHAS